MRAASLAAFVLLAVLVPQAARALELSDPDVTRKGGAIVVSAEARPGPREMNDLSNGVSKEMVFYVDLFRVWRAWPDEFVLGRVITRTLKCDPLRKDYTANSLDGTTLLEKKFKDCEALSAWALKVPEITLTNTAELPPDMYFVRVTVESRLRRLPPVAGFFFFFVREVEASASKDSPAFPIGSGK